MACRNHIEKWYGSGATRERVLQRAVKYRNYIFAFEQEQIEVC